MGSLAGKTAVVTGATSGIGKAIALALTKFLLPSIERARGENSR